MRIIVGLMVLGLVAACAVEEGASVQQIDAARAVTDKPPSIAVVTMVKRRDNRAAHSALVINGSQQVIYDPAGSFSHPELVERGDILYGANDRLVDYYERYHARSAYFVHVQKFNVSPEVAEIALNRAQAQGPSPKMFCNIDTVAVLNEVPGFGGLKSSFFPEDLRRQIAQKPGVQNRYLYEEDHGKNVPMN
ncbi:hypothetical protein [Oceanibium sediminis]|uniref:hypothetical protein n=1 Tax=Oceanibium sediminis TaxID=2026339 RepID=UPI0013009F22|nr:hypothetical protein [Oceanibium sediminis]